MKSVDIDQFTSKFDAYLDLAIAKKEPLCLVKGNKKLAVLLDIETFEELEDIAQDMVDLEEIQAQTDQQSIPWDQVKAELGLP